MSSIQILSPSTWLRALTRSILALAFVSLPAIGHSGSAGIAAERPLTTRVIQSGHSLTDPIPPVLTRMVHAAGGSGVIAQSTIPGSPMEWRWENPTTSPDARLQIADFDVLVLTERVPLSNTLPWHGSEKSALEWFEHAWTNGNGGKGAETILYASWVGIDSGPSGPNPHNDPEAHIPWRDRLPLEIERWEQIADFVNANRPDGSPAMRVIPGPQIMAAIHDGIADGSAPDLKAISELFSDTIHLNDLGAYAIALAHFAVIYGRDPRDLPADLGAGKAPSPALANWLQEIVWKTVTAYQPSGVAAAAR